MKKFFEVFPTLQVKEDLAKKLSELSVERVAMTTSRDLLRVYISGTSLIQKEDIFKAEKEIASQVFRNTSSVKIRERYTLSSQYTPSILYERYKESIKFELRNYNVLLYNLYKSGEITFSEDESTLLLSLEESVISRQLVKDLKLILEKIFCDRFGFSVIVNYKLTEPKEKPEKEEVALAEADLAEYKPVIREAEKKTEKPAENKPKEEQKAASEGKPNVKTFGRKEGFKPRKKSDNPDVFFGRDFEGETIPIDQIQGEIGEVIIKGRVVSTEEMNLKKSEKVLFIFTVTDYTDTIKGKLFLMPEELDEIRAGLKKGNFVMINGIAVYDTYDKEVTLQSVRGIKKTGDFRIKRTDNATEKRCELHLHTKMSDMDGVSDVKDIIAQAIAFGHKSMAITDHGVVQSFPLALHALHDNHKGVDFKIIYGVEGYLVDDTKKIVNNPKGQSLDDTYVVFDIETTGLSTLNCNIIEIGAVKVQNGAIIDRFSTFVNPKVPIPYEIELLTHITDDMVKDAPDIDTVLPQFLEFSKDAVMVAHNAGFDMSFITMEAKRQGLPLDKTVVDTVECARFLMPSLGKLTLDNIAKSLNVVLESHHRAVDDAECTAEIFVKFIKQLKGRNINTLDELNENATLSDEAIAKLHAYHVIILAKNDIGRINLYRLVSYSHLKYFNRRPKIPKSVINANREGLIIGSACEAGELYRAILEGKSDSEITRIVEFYDYLELQPLGNNAFMVRDPKIPINSMDEIKEINKKILKLGDDFGKPVCATCDVHFLNPEDEVYRRIIMAGNGFADADDQAPLYFRTTDEMLKEFDYLDPERAYEIVVKNPNMISDMCEYIEPVRPDKCPPVIEDSDKTLREICYNKAHEMYGEELPEIVKARLDRELNSIISNGYAVMYIIAQKLVWKSNDDGYLVGSRGSVGSSFVATMSGITEVNPLSPHYYCSECHYSDFDSEEVKAFSGRSGCDMPDKICPVCGAKLKKDGFDIPFETFLGFKGNKEPDIDLNFSGEYQSNAHKYTEVIFGKGQTFRAGTIATLADKTAYGYVKKYYEERNIHKRGCEIERIVGGCVGVRRSTGQHPGGIIVLPKGEEIYSFTPIQHPANDMTTETITTHFEYHSIDHNLLKLDILGHDDPTMIRMLEDITGIDAKSIPLDCPEVMSLFKNTSALNISPEDIGGCKLGCLGIPEFGTDFAMNMVIDAAPQSFSDLIRISGLSHGTDVWVGNAKDLITSGTATLSSCICCRDDIMIYLISMGLESELSFTIMESVRKGKGLKPEWEEEMTAHGVPDWYIGSCKKIKYMFPKAHAAAYVMMAWRIAYCKVFYPLAFYASFLSIRAKAFNYEMMCLGPDRVRYHIEDFEKRKDTLSNVENDAWRDLRIVQEMYARGFEFWPLDIYRADATRFKVIDGKIMPAINSLKDMGDIAAESIVEAAKGDKFLSLEDFKNRTKVSQKSIDYMASLGLFGDLPKSNQISLSDLFSEGF
ncbi:MAG: PolC-type DNA polymerase III [Lachnospiraceae bacterium]|nr:PolC-type DNA polymerase III [Lachnospiraceae bacterium]